MKSNGKEKGKPGKWMEAHSVVKALERQTAFFSGKVEKAQQQISEIKRELEAMCKLMEELKREEWLHGGCRC